MRNLIATTCFVFGDERRSGELLKELARASHDRGNQHEAKSAPVTQPKSPYAEALSDNESRIGFAKIKEIENG